MLRLSMVRRGASARETAARVAAGAICKQLLSQLGVEVISHVVQMGGSLVLGGVAALLGAPLAITVMAVIGTTIAAAVFATVPGARRIR